MTSPTPPTPADAPAGPLPASAALSLDDLRTRRDDIRRLVALRRGCDVVVAGLDPVRLVVDFDQQATLLDLAGLTQDLEDLLGVVVRIETRDSATGPSTPRKTGAVL